MGVDDLDVFGAVLRPNETDAPLPVHADAVLAFAVALQGFKAVVRRYPKVFQHGHAVLRSQAKRIVMSRQPQRLARIRTRWAAPQ